MRRRGRFRRWASATKLTLVLHYRAGFVQVYLALAVLSVIAVKLFLPREWTSFLVPALLLGEYGTLGLYLVAAERYLERDEGSSSALAVTPLDAREQVAAMVAAPGLVATVAGLVVFAGTIGVNGRLVLLVPPLSLTTVVAGCSGVILSSYVSAFTRFLLASIPVSALFHLPFLSYLGLAPRAAFVWLPWDAALFSFASLSGVEIRPGAYLVMLGELFAFSIVGLLWAERVFRRRVLERMDMES